ncbi:hypothetical protein COL41_04300 [Bacillus mycoides]|nr:hypothetical protein COL41_04300 [Bacillus mycoides]
MDSLQTVEKVSSTVHLYVSTLDKKEIKTNIVCRWFVGFSLSEMILDYSTVSWNCHALFIYKNILRGL